MATHPPHSAHDHTHDHHGHDDHAHAPAARAASAPRFNLIALSGFQRLFLILPLILALWLATFWATA